MTHSARICVLAVLTLAAAGLTSQAAHAGCCPQGGSSFAMCQVPVTKGYKVQPGFCPQQLVAMVAHGVPCDGSDCCGPFGIPPIYASGNYVMVRQTVEGHQQVAKFLTDLGAYVPIKTIAEVQVGN